MAKLAIFGGTFNPIHNGHLRLLRNISEQVSLDEIILMPTHIPPHKRSEDLASDEQRLEMCRRAVENTNISVSDYEINRGGISYTVETLRHFHELYPDDRLYFIMGSDMFLSLHTWYCFEEILSLAGIITACREENELHKLKQYEKTLEKFSAEVIIVPAEAYVISSSVIRNLVKTGKDFTCYLPETIVQYINEKKLYL